MFEKTMVRSLVVVVLLAVGGSAWGQVRPGDLYEADSYSSTVYEFTPSGIRTTFASGFEPTGLAFDKSGDLFASDYSNGNIYEFNATSGSRSTFASGLLKPQALAFDSSDNLYVVESNYGGVGSVYEYTGGSRSAVVSGLDDPCGLTFDSSGNLYVTNYLSGSIEKVSSGGAPSTFASGLSYPQCLAIGGNGTLFETDGGSGNIYEFASNGSRSTFASGFDGGYGTGLDGLAFDSNGNLFVGDDGTGNILEFSSSGQTTFASGLDVPEFLAFAPTPVPEPSALGAPHRWCYRLTGLRLEGVENGTSVILRYQTS